MSSNTEQQFKEQVALCRTLFAQKAHDYSSAWRVLRPSSLTDQILIKVRRIRNIQIIGNQQVEDDVRTELIGIVNYAIMALIQLEHGVADTADLSAEQAIALYDEKSQSALSLMLRKNHDYGEAWREMRPESIADIILMKVLRTKELEDLNGQAIVSEGIDANYLDMINYAIFVLIKTA